MHVWSQAKTDIATSLADERLAFSTAVNYFLLLWKCCWYNIPLLAWKMCKWLDTPPETVQDEEGSSSTSAPTISLRVPRASERPDPRAYRCTSESGSDLSGSQTAAILLIGSIQWASIADWKSTITDVVKGHVVASCDKNLAVLQPTLILDFRAFHQHRNTTSTNFSNQLQSSGIDKTTCTVQVLSCPWKQPEKLWLYFSSYLFTSPALNAAFCNTLFHSHWRIKFLSCSKTCETSF